MAGRRQPTAQPYDMWTFEDDSKMLDLLVEQVNLGNKLPNGVGKHEVYMDCVNKFNEDAVNKKTIEQVKNRTRSWKKIYQTVTSCINTSGFGWDATAQRVTASNAVWLDQCKEHKDVEKYRREGCLLYDKLAMVVGNTITMGSGGITFVEQGDELFRESEHVLIDEPEDVDIVNVDIVRDTPSPALSVNESIGNQSKRSSSSRRRKKTKISVDDTSNKLVDAMDRISMTLANFMKPKEPPMPKEPKPDWAKALLEILDQPVDLKFRASSWLNTPRKRELFTKMTVEDPVEWLKYCEIK